MKEKRRKGREVRSWNIMEHHRTPSGEKKERERERKEREKRDKKREKREKKR